MQNVGTSAAEVAHAFREDLFRINVTVGEKVMEKLDRAKELLGNADLATVLDRALDCYLKAHCPKQQQERRKVRKAKVVEKKAVVTAKTVRPENSRYVPAELKASVLERDGYRCTYVGVDGIRCQARACLEMDHCQPFGMGGKTEFENLRTLCRGHNALQARSAYGAERIAERIASRRETETSQLR